MKTKRYFEEIEEYKREVKNAIGITILAMIVAIMILIVIIV